MRSLEISYNLLQRLILGNPLDPETTLGPCISVEAAEAVRIQIREAIAKGAQCLLDVNWYPTEKEGTAYLAPQALINVNHRMKIVHEECFGPLVTIMKVSCKGSSKTRAHFLLNYPSIPIRLHRMKRLYD